MLLKYPLHLKFKFFSLTPQVSVQDANGQEIMFVRQKMFALREEVKIYSNALKTEELYKVKAQQIIDFGAEYLITKSSSEQTIGSLKQQGLKTIWRATYFLRDNSGNDKYLVSEINPWIKVLDYLVGQIPIVNFFTGYMFHPKYSITSIKTSEHVVTLVKKPSFLEKTFDLELLSQNLTAMDEELITIGLMVMVLQQKSRG